MGQPDKEWDELLLLKLALGVLITAGPALVVAFGANVGSWCLRHQVLVPSSRALFTIPTLDAGPDFLRAVVAVLVLAAALLALVRIGRASRRARTRAALQDMGKLW